ATSSEPFALLGPGALAVSNLVFEVPILGATNIDVLFAPANAGTFINTVLFASGNGQIASSVSGKGFDLPLIAWASPNGLDFTFSFPTVAGLIYAVQYKDSLEDPLWQ